VGFDGARGDTVQVINSPFVMPEPMEPLPEPGLLEQAWVWELGKGLLAALGVLALILTVLRPMVKYSTSYAPPALAAASANPTLAGPDAAQGANQGVALALPPTELPSAAPKPNYQQSLAMARNSASEEPVRAAYVVKNWIAADG
jgi:flagellar M-ring protein FliF